MFYDMGQIKINSLDVRIFGCDQFEVNAKTTTNVHQLSDALKAMVEIEDPLHVYSGGVMHGFVENLIEPGIHTWVLKRVHSINPVEWYSSFQDRSFQFAPESTPFINIINGKIRFQSYRFPSMKTETYIHTYTHVKIKSFVYE